MYMGGHQGDPGNEAADTLAQHAAMNSFTTVMSLKEKFVSSYMATMSFLDQCHAKGISIVALQETRLRQLKFAHAEYWHWQPMQELF